MLATTMFTIIMWKGLLKEHDFSDKLQWLVGREKKEIHVITELIC